MAERADRRARARRRGPGRARSVPGPHAAAAVPLLLRRPPRRRIADVRYADGAGRRHLADVYVPRNGVENAAVLLQIHGGAWLVGNKRQQGRPMMNRMAAAGWVCVAINYRLAPRQQDAGRDRRREARARVDPRAHRRVRRRPRPDHRERRVRGRPPRGDGRAHRRTTPSTSRASSRPTRRCSRCVPLYPPTDLARARSTTAVASDATDGRAHDARGCSAPARPRTPSATAHWSPDHARAARASCRSSSCRARATTSCRTAQTRAFVERLRAQPGQQVVYLELPGAPHAFEVFHSLRAEAAASAVHRFCASVTRERRWPTTSPRVRATSSGPGSGGGRRPNRRRGTLSERSDDHGAYGAVVSAASASSTPS